MLNILEQQRLKIFVHLLLRRNIFITLIIILCLFYSVNYPLFLILSIILIYKFRYDISYKILFLSIIIFFSGLFVLHSRISHQPFTNKDIVVIDKQQQSYTYQYIVKDQQVKFILYSQVEYPIGTKLTIDGEIIPFDDVTIPKGFNAKHYYLSQGIVGRINDLTVIDWNEKTSLQEYLYDWKEKYSDTEIEPLMDAFIFDDQKELRAFNFQWLFYLFSVSGLHIFALSQWIIFIFKIRQKHIEIYVKLIIVLFFFIFQPFHYSIIRILWMNAALLLMTIFRIQIPKYVILALIWIIILLIQPYKIYDIGLFISFFLVMNMYLSHDQTSHALLTQYHIILLATSLIFLLNGRLMLIPIIFMPMFVFIVIYTIFMPTLFMFILQLEFTFFMDWFDQLFTLFEGIHRYVGGFQLVMPSVLLTSLSIIIIFLIHMSPYKKRIVKRLITLLIFFFISGHIFVLNQVPTLMFLDVGQGDATVYIDKECVVVIDAFSNVESYVRSNGKQHIDYLFLTHSDLDHIKEAKHLVENLLVKQVITSPYQQIDGIQTSTPFQFPSTYFCGEIKIDVLGPIDSMFDDNDDSLIILLNFLGKKILFTGDASIKREHQIITYFKEDIDVLKVGHHGSKTSTSIDLLHHLNPEYSIISSSKNNRYGMPHEEVINALEIFRVKYFNTSIHGSIQMTIFKGEIKWETYPP